MTHYGLSHICCPSQDGLVPVASLGVENKAFENEQGPELEEGASQPDSEVKVQVDWTSELPVGVSVPRVHIHSLVVDFSAVSFLDVVAAKSLKLVRHLYCSLLSWFYCNNVWSQSDGDPHILPKLYDFLSLAEHKRRDLV